MTAPIQLTDSPAESDQQIVEVLQKIREVIDPALFFKIDRSHVNPLIKKLVTNRGFGPHGQDPAHLEQFFVGPLTPTQTTDVSFYFTITLDYLHPTASTAQLIVQDNDDWAFLHINELTLRNGTIPLPTGAIWFNRPGA